MFPLSETFIFVAVFATVLGVLCLLLYAVIGRARAAAIGGAVALCAVLFVIVLGSGPFYDASTEFVLTGFAFCLTPIFALFWVMIVRRYVARLRWGLLAAVLPALGILGVFFERQIVPQDVCSQSHVPVRVAGVTLTLPPEFGATIWLGGAGEYLSYDRRARNKEDMARLCALSAGGTEPAEAALVSIAPGLYPKPLQEACEGTPSLSFCKGYNPALMTGLGALQVFPAGGTALRYELGQRDAKDALFVGDEAAGHMCRLEGETGQTRHCRLWRSLSDGVRVLITTQNGGTPVAPEIKLAKLEAALSFYLRALRP